MIDSLAETVCAGDPLSFTETVKFEVPLAVGVPEITPALDSNKPAGSFPEGSDHVKPGVPPFALSCAAYEDPITPAPSGVELTLSPLGALCVAVTTIEYVAVLLRNLIAESVAVTLKVEVPTAIGVPEITPPFDSVSPAGRLPDEMLHL